MLLVDLYPGKGKLELGLSKHKLDLYNYYYVPYSLSFSPLFLYI